MKTSVCTLLFSIFAFTGIHAEEATQSTNQSDQAVKTLCPSGCGCEAPCACGCTEGKPCNCHEKNRK